MNCRSFMRPPAFDLAAAVLPEIRVEMIRDDPYARLVRFRRDPFRSRTKEDFWLWPGPSGDRTVSA